MYYGFQPIRTTTLEREEIFTRGVGENTDIIEKEMYNLKTKGGDKLVLRPEGTAPVMRAYMEHGMHTWPQPVMFYYFEPMFRHENPQQGRFREHNQFGLEMIGTKKSIADAVIIRTMVDILEEVGFSNLVIEINSIGDSESRPAFIRALTAYYKKQAKNLCPHCKDRLKKNPLRLLDCKDERCVALKEHAPDPLSYLSADSKKHFKEVLEYLGSMDIPFRINNSLVRGLDYYTHTVFEVISEPEDTEETEGGDKPKSLTIAGGGRYDNLSKHLGSKKSIPGVGGSIGVERLLALPNLNSVTPRIIKKPKVYFIQLGFEAKLKSLTIIEMLRKARIPIAQSLSKDSLSAQLSAAEKAQVKYAIIFGQKEAMEGNVIVRNMETRSQDPVPLNELPEYLKKIK